MTMKPEDRALIERHLPGYRHDGGSWVCDDHLAALIQAARTEGRESRPSDASDRLGAWMSAALDDPKVCDAMKADIRAWFDAGQPVPVSQGKAEEGWVLVPREPTEEMLRKGAEAGLSMSVLLDDTPFACDRAVYAAMIAATPTTGERMPKLSEHILRGFRWTIHRLRLARGFLCWCFFMVWPSWRGGWWTTIGHAALPYAGDYAYADDPWCKDVWNHWVLTGRDLKQEVTDGPF